MNASYMSTWKKFWQASFLSDRAFITALFMLTGNKHQSNHKFYCQFYTQHGTFLVFHMKVVFTCIHKIPIIMPTELWCQSITWCIEVVRNQLRSVFWRKWRVSEFADSAGHFGTPELFGGRRRVCLWSDAGVVPVHSQPTSEVLPGSTFRFLPKTGFQSNNALFRDITCSALIPQWWLWKTGPYFRI